MGAAPTPRAKVSFRSRVAAFSLPALAVLFAATSAQAATVVVDRQSDAAPAPGQCTSAGTPDCSLRQAIDKAMAGDTVVVPASTTRYSVSLGELALNKPITLAGAGARSTIIDAAGANQRVVHVTGSGTATIRGLTITGADLQTAVGGGVLVDAGMTLRLVDSAVAGNRADNSGGGIRVDGGALHVSGSAVIGNHGDSSSNGGGLSFSNAGDSTITNTTIAGNSAQNVGGGLFAENTSVTAANVTLTGNGGNSAGGVYVSSAEVSFRNSILAGNTATSIPSQSNCVGVGFANPTSAGNNIEDENTCLFAGGGDKPSTNPRLGPVQNNGGPTDTRALLAGSPAIGAGSLVSCPLTDQRGALRPGGIGCDIGAYEVALARATTAEASAVGATTAGVRGIVSNPDLAPGTAVFDYGTTTAYGRSTPEQRVGPVSRSAAVASTLTNLKPGTRYHFRLRVRNALGSAVGGDGTFVTPAARAALRRLRISPAAFRAARKGGPVGNRRTRPRRAGARVSYRSTQPGTVTFTVQRRAAGRRQAGKCRKVTRRNRGGRPCTRWVRVPGRFRRRAVAGANTFRFTGRMSRRSKLAPGRYRLRAVARNGAGAGRAVTRPFRIKR